MTLSQLALTAAAGGCLWTAVATAATWRPVPGAPEVEIEFGSMELERTRVLVWLRMAGRPALVPELAAHGARAPRISRTALRTEFDCGHRTMRILAANAYDSGGATTFMSSIPGPVLPVQGEDMGWTYDAVCEAARAARRL